MSPSSNKKLVLVSGYYGFGNLGDEAILEEITNELKKLVEPSQIVVLSNDPDQTKRIFGVDAVNRWKLADFLKLLPDTDLLISGGGGLFQDSTGIKSTVFYGTQILAARAYGKQVCVYAQGIGPLNTAAAKTMARFCLSKANHVLVRDKDSKNLLSNWGIESQLTADPVWCLDPTNIPLEANQQIISLRETPGITVGLSLRTSHNFADKQLENLISVMDRSFPLDTKILLLPLQANQDLEPLNKFAAAWKERGRPVEFLKTEEIEKPSQWLAVLAQLDMLVGMRLHALIMTLKSGVPCVGIAYDPKVQHVLKQFTQPILNLQKTGDQSGAFKEWLPTMQNAVASRLELAKQAKKEAENAKNAACQNFETLARILIHAK